MIKLKTKEEIDILREGGKRLAEILRAVKAKVAPGVTTSELDELAYDLVKEGGDKPAFRGYRPQGSPLAYPASLCTSVNEEIVHGIPSKRVLKEGDVVGLDLGLEHEGLFTDHAVSVPVGAIDHDLRTLLAVTEEALYAGIKAAGPGKHLGDIGAAIEALADKYGYGLIEELSGHGVGYKPHEDPFVPNFGQPGAGLKLEPGLVIAIEPMFALGTGDIKLEKDGFTFTTRDKKASAHFEHTIVITADGHEILTK
ncbi:MAG: type I methionyl aminopeptidase [Candidatus Vogelbacteria bacterium]|nr:type I methionyl aminopeptidase [Candidatus Vogelbacteria bacterium]